MTQLNDCTWHPAIRWLSFLPLGVLGTAIVQALIRWANAETPFLAELLSRIAEPWVFFLISLWILPRFNRAFLLITSLIYIFIYLSTAYFTAVDDTFSSQSWADYSISATAISSCAAALYYFVNIFHPGPDDPS